MRHRAGWMLVTTLAILIAIPGATAARAPEAVAAATCAKETKRLKAFKRGMRAAKRRYFRTHRSKQARKRFVQRQRRKLRRLKRARRRCLARMTPAPVPAPAPGPAPVPAAGGGGPPPQPPPPPSPPAVGAISDVVSESAEFTPGELSVENGVRFVRTQLELELKPGATVAGMNALLDRVDAEVVSSLDGVGLLTVRIPDPGSLAALRAKVAAIAGDPALAHADTVTVPVPLELPDTIDAADVDMVRPQLASRASGAWNARGALAGTTPTLLIADFFGAGPPGAEVAVAETASDFETGNPLAHGYTILGLAAATFEPGAVGNLAADEVTGMWAGPDLPLRVVDLRRNIAGSTAQDRILQTVRATSGDIVLNTSFEDGCARAGCTAAQIEQDARQWIARVRSSGLEGRFLHVSAAGNIYPDLLTDTQAARGAAFNAAVLTPPPGVAPLTNTVVVENTTASDPADGPVAPLCLTATSKRGGHISAVGNDIKSFSAPGVFRDLPAGGTSSATPQVAGAAATVWALAPSLTPAQLAAVLRTTARPITTNSGDARCTPVQAPPALDAYSAALAADGVISRPARSEILDANGDGTFDEQDLLVFRDEFIAAAGTTDYSRFDLNGDGRTGGGRDRIDLDARSPVEFTFSRRREVLGIEVLHDETQVRDLDVLCHEAHGPSYGGDVAARDLFAEQFCLPPVQLEVDPAFPGTLQPGQSVPLRVVARNSDLLAHPAVSQLPGVHLDYSLTSGTLGAADGTTGQDGAFSTNASLGPSGDFNVDVIARAGVGGPELDRVTVTAARAGAGVVIVDQVRSRVRALAEACAGEDGLGCVIHTDTQEDSSTALGTFAGSKAASMTRTGSPGFYEGNSASASANVTLDSEITTSGAPLEVQASGSSGGAATRTFGANPSAHAAYNGQGSVFVRFRVLQDSVGYSVDGTGTGTSAGTASGSFRLYRVAPFQFVVNHLNEPFDASGELAPGTYEMDSGTGCTADTPVSCTASFSVTFRLEP